ncbi:hypothetical protein, partial [Roseiarcus sp.]|uniref:hypothetical protein n=1 Tax=Roseiarcus sp. TaxID=1969460 RepID=UPI003F9BEC83
MLCMGSSCINREVFNCGHRPAPPIVEQSVELSAVPSAALYVEVRPHEHGLASQLLQPLTIATCYVTNLARREIHEPGIPAYQTFVVLITDGAQNRRVPRNDGEAHADQVVEQASPPVDLDLALNAEQPAAGS